MERFFCGRQGINRLEAVLASSWIALGLSWDLLGCSWASLGTVFCSLGVPFALILAILRRLGAPFWPKWAQDGKKEMIF